LGAELISGSFFKGMVTDSMHVIVNESFVKNAGWTDALGQVVSRGEGRDFKIIGVVRDFALGNAQYDANPAIFRYSAGRDIEDMRGYIHIKSQGDYDKSLALIANTWEKYVAEEPLDAFFLDDSFNRLYDDQRRFGHVFISFSALTILIAFIGLFSLTAFTLEQKLKEIAIRKIMGASTTKVISQILLSFIKLIGIGALLAFIPVYYLGNEWLNGFDYRISIDAAVILFPFGAILILSAGVIALKSYHTANDNPVNALRTE
jgi:putative ABC transport system permease protein